MSTVIEPISTGRNKISIVGVGQVGMACAFSILTNVRPIGLRQICIYSSTNV